MTDQLPTQALAGLTQEEAEFAYNCEVLGLPVRKAAQLAGLAPGSLCKPHVQQARELLKREVRGQMAITKEDVLFGVRDAIDRARILADPETEIKGWAQISKMLGYDAPQKVDVNVTASIEVLKQHVKSLPEAQLAKLIGAEDIIDADFYDVSASQK